MLSFRRNRARSCSYRRSMVEVLMVCCFPHTSLMNWVPLNYSNTARMVRNTTTSRLPHMQFEQVRDLLPSQERTISHAAVAESNEPTHQPAVDAHRMDTLPGVPPMARVLAAVPGGLHGLAKYVTLILLLVRRCPRTSRPDLQPHLPLELPPCPHKRPTRPGDSAVSAN